MSGRLVSKRQNWNQIKRRLARFDQRSFDVGFFSNSKYGAENDNLPVATVAWMNDQGTSTVPPRPFMTVDFKMFVEKSFRSDAKTLFLTLLLQKNSPYLKELNNIAEKYKNALTRIIYDYEGSNSDWWAEVKGFDDPLFYTGTMVNSVEFKVKKRQ